jgi:serine/threonine protein kinase/tetratricopeptide (TPR) repeat protein
MPSKAQDDELVMNLLELALARPTEEREDYLKSACAGDEDLRTRVQEYIRWEERMNGFLLEPLFCLAPNERPFEPGQLLDNRFRIVREVAEGGMGVVYEAVDEKLERRIAIKCAKTGFCQRLPPEVRNAREIRHPNVCKIFEIHTASTDKGEIDFLTMEFLDGETLADRLSRGPVPEKEARLIARQLCGGLAEAHRNQVVHGDLKSNNIFLTSAPDGATRVVITDFGLARGPEAAQRTAQSSEIAGTPDYMAPELWKGRKVSMASDIYALGVILYELVAGRRPYGAETSWEERLTRKPPVLHSKWDWILSRCLDPDSGRRFQDAEEVSLALDSQRSGRWLVTRVAAIGVAIMLAVIALAPSLRDRVAGWLHRQPLPAQKLLAVLPFSTTNQANQALTDGLNDILSYKLAELEQFHGSLLVVAASEVNARGAKTPSSARQLLGVNLVIVGNVVQSGDQCQALVSLVDTHNRVQLRSAAIEGKLSEITVFRDRVVSRVAQMLDLELSTSAQRKLAAGETSNATAYASYLKGRGYLQRREVQGNLERAAVAFRDSIAKDPRYALAYTGLAETLYRQYGVKKDPQLLDDAFGTCSRAIELNDQLEPVHVIMGMLKSAKGDYEGAEAEFKRVLALNPSNPDAQRGLAETYQLQSRMKDAEAAYKQAIALRPNDWANHIQLGVFYFDQSCLAEAETYFQKVAQLAPGNYLAYLDLGSTYLEMGRDQEAIAMWQKALALNPENPRIYSNLGTAYNFERRYAEAARWHEKAIALAPNSEVYWGNLAYAERWEPSLAAKAPEAFRRAIDLGQRSLISNPRDANRLARLAEYWAALGQKNKSLSEVARAEALAPKSGYVQYRAAVVYEQAGDRKRALTAAQTAIELGYSLEEIQHAVPLDNLRKDPRYRQLLENGRAEKSCSLK